MINGDDPICEECGEHECDCTCDPTTCKCGNDLVHPSDEICDECYAENAREDYNEEDEKGVNRYEP